MSIRALKTLLSIAKHGTFARAADDVGLTQSAVSLHVKSLEAEFRASLFDRSRRQPMLTEAGELVVARARQIVAMYENISAEVATDGVLAGRLRVGAIQTALSGPLPGALARLRESAPRLRIHVSAGMSAELAVLVSEGELDAAIATRPVKPFPASLIATRLYSDSFWVIAPPGAKGQDLSHLVSAYPFIRFDPRAWAGRMIETELRKRGLQIREEMVLDSQEAIVQMVSKGLGVAIVPIANEEAAFLEECVRLPFGEPQLSREVVLLEREDRVEHKATQALAQAIIATHQEKLRK